MGSIADARRAHHSMRRNRRTLHAAIGIADGRDGRRPRGVGIGRYAKRLPQMHRGRGRLDLVVLRRHGRVRAALGCGARVTICGLALTAGSVTLASIWIGFGSGFGFGSTICALLQLHLGRLRRRRHFRRRRLLDLHSRRRITGNDQLRHLVLLLDHLLGRHAHIHGQRQNRHVDDGTGNKSSGPAFGLGQQT